MAAPRQTGADAVTAVPVDTAGIDLIKQAFGTLLVGREDAGGESVASVVHEFHRFGITRHLLDANDGTEALFTHQLHAVVDVGKHGRLEPVTRAASTGATGQ